MDLVAFLWLISTGKMPANIWKSLEERLHMPGAHIGLQQLLQRLRAQGEPYTVCAFDAQSSPDANVPRSRRISAVSPKKIAAAISTNWNSCGKWISLHSSRFAAMREFCRWMPSHQGPLLALQLGHYFEIRTGSLLEAFISLSDKFERILVTPGRRRSVLSTKAL